MVWEFFFKEHTSQYLSDAGAGHGADSQLVKYVRSCREPLDPPRGSAASAGAEGTMILQ